MWEEGKRGVGGGRGREGREEREGGSEEGVEGRKERESVSLIYSQQVTAIFLICF